jgi:pilus assembly protein Flp/PilA
MTMRAIFTNLVKDESGVTAIEYGLIAALIAVVCIAVWTAIGTGLSATFNSVSSSL